MTDWTRRQVLQRSGVAVSAVGLSGLAGCTGGDGGDGSSTGDGNAVSDGSNESGSGGGSTNDGDSDGGDGQSGSSTLSYGTWLAPPDAFSDRERYFFQSRQPSALLSLESALGGAELGGFDQNPAPGVEWNSVEYLHDVPGGAVLAGEFPVDEWQSSLTDRGITESESYQGYTLYTGENGGTVAFGDGSAVVNQSRESGLSTLKTVIDVRTGQTQRAAVANEDIGALVTALGEGTTVVGATTPTDEQRFVPNSVAAGQRFSLGESESEYHLAVVYESEDSVDVGTVADRVGGSELFDGTGNLTTERRGRTAVVTGSLPSEQVSTLNPSLSGDSNDQRDAPSVAFAFDYDANTGVLEITHEGGDNVDPSKLFVIGSGFTEREGVDMTAPGQWQGTSDDGQVQAGDAVSVGVTSAYNIVVAWGGTTENVQLAEDFGPEA